MSDLRAYQELVNTKANEESHELLPNAGEKHAAIVMSKMFDLTKHEVNMIVGSLDGKVSNQTNYMESLIKCVERGIRINMLFLNTPNKSSQALNYLKQKKSEGAPITLKLADQKEMKRYAKKEIHFSIFDDNKFRYEKDTKNYLAWFCFNNAEIAKSLKSLFKLSFDHLPEMAA